MQQRALDPVDFGRGCPEAPESLVLVLRIVTECARFDDRTDIH
jgi:hypothetical protein